MATADWPPHLPRQMAGPFGPLLLVIVFLCGLVSRPVEGFLRRDFGPRLMNVFGVVFSFACLTMFGMAITLGAGDRPLDLILVAGLLMALVHSRVAAARFRRRTGQSSDSHSGDIGMPLRFWNVLRSVPSCSVSNCTIIRWLEPLLVMLLSIIIKAAGSPTLSWYLCFAAIALFVKAHILFMNQDFIDELTIDGEIEAKRRAERSRASHGTSQATVAVVQAAQPSIAPAVVAATVEPTPPAPILRCPNCPNEIRLKEPFVAGRRCRCLVCRHEFITDPAHVKA